ncbi:conserved hypothetical protein (DUF389) [Synechococcus sp. MEDNS5]|uniref:DUF389 domain-containing protein n=1 Tax=Synechococcus sp. MEDNS5 TaxID=1442554 RepID=UPI0016444764|nr:DUF389 domain-containing protein [Synechococcus sp. MEDNS5]QNJ07003.1 conserved hypothetical protein (DUF389) [Synechococcus sp. MEDNS5]
MDSESDSSRMLKRLHRSHMHDAALDEVFIVLSVGASLIATLGLLANSAAVVIGAMVVAPWIMPLRAAAFAILLGEVQLLGRSLRTLMVGVVSTTLLSLVLGSLADLPRFGTEVLTRTTPNLLDLGIALVAGGLATYAKLRSDAVSSLAGTAIAVALVPPVCVMGLLLSQQQWTDAAGAGLLFATNLLGILTGGLVLMAWKDPEFRQVFRRSHLSAASFTLTGLLLLPLGSSFFNLLDRARKDNTRDMLQETIESFLMRETLTFGDRESVDVERVDIAWNQDPPIIRVVVRVSDPALPSFKQVSAVQEAINRRQDINFRLVVQRTAVDVVGPEVAPNPATPATEQLLSPAPEPEQAIDPTESDVNPAEEDLRVDSKPLRLPDLQQKAPTLR